MHRTMHCLAVGQGQSWQAYCFDLDLAVEGQSFEEAQNRLKAVIASYLEAAQESGDPALLERKTPFWVRLRFALKAFVGTMFDRDGDGYQHQFTMPCPA